MTTHIVHGAAETLSTRHLPSWLVLAMAAGATNAGAFLASQRYVTHVTGTVTQVGLDIGQWFLMFEYWLVLLAFIVGAFISVLAVQARVLTGKRPVPWVPLLAVVALLTVTAIAGHFGIFGVMGGELEETSDFAFLCLLALAMGLMNATVASTTALSVRTTHMTGPATDVGVHLGVAIYSTGEARRQALQLAALRGGKIVAFVLGAVLMTEVAAEHFGYLSFLLPALLITFATARSYAPSAMETPKLAPASVPNR